MSYVSEIGRAFAQPERVRGGTTRLAAEYALFFVILPVAFAVFMPSDLLFPVLFAFAATGLILLHFTPGFQWRMLARSVPDLPSVIAFAALTMAAATVLVMVLVPSSFLSMPRDNPRLMLMIGLFYPFLSALPQELVYRVLYFRRYEPVIPRGAAGLILNGFVFALAHLMYWNWVSFVMTFAGGIAFAYGYKRRGGIATAFLMHALAGLIMFAVGLGHYFYSGAVVRPF